MAAYVVGSMTPASPLNSRCVRPSRSHKMRRNVQWPNGTPCSASCACIARVKARQASLVRCARRSDLLMGSPSVLGPSGESLGAQRPPSCDILRGSTPWVSRQAHAFPGSSRVARAPHEIGEGSGRRLLHRARVVGKDLPPIRTLFKTKCFARTDWGKHKGIRPPVAYGTLSEFWGCLPACYFGGRRFPCLRTARFPNVPWTVSASSERALPSERCELRSPKSPPVPAVS